MASCYVIRCSGGQYYVGSARNVVKRFNDHKHGRVKYTKNKRPLKLVFVKDFNCYIQAYDFEQKVKSWKKRKSIERMLDKPDNIVGKYCLVV